MIMIHSSELVLPGLTPNTDSKILHLSHLRSKHLFQFSMRPLRRGFPAKGTPYRKAEMSSMLEGQAMCSTERASNKLGYQTTLLIYHGVSERFPCDSLPNSFLAPSGRSLLLCFRIFEVKIRASKSNITIETATMDDLAPARSYRQDHQ